MRLFIKLMIAILVIGVLLPFTFLKGKDGKPVISFTDLKLPDISMPDMPNLPDNETLGDKDVIYKWTDAEGSLQFSNTPPPDGVEYTVKGYDPNLNVIRAVDVESNVPIEVVEEESKKKVTSAEDIGSPYSPEKIGKLFEDANNIEKLLNQRLNNQEALIGQ
jgi:hypothetical protein